MSIITERYEHIHAIAYVAQLLQEKIHNDPDFRIGDAIVFEFEEDIFQARKIIAETFGFELEIIPDLTNLPALKELINRAEDLELVEEI